MLQVSGVCLKRIDRDSYDKNGVCLIDKKTLLLVDAKVSVLVPYIRFNNVDINLRSSWKSNEEVIGMFLPILRKLGPAFSFSSLLINARIDEQNPRCFSSNAELLEFVEEQLLPMFNRPRPYTFKLDFSKHSSENTFKTFVSSVFEHRLMLMGHISNIAVNSSL